MAFLDNSGDIILDAVLTDAGRKRLARGDGSFSIAQYAFGDDEINYALYQNANHPDGAHASGSAYYDLEIIQTPVLESFTNNSSTMKSTLMSLSTNNFFYLPVLKLNTNIPEGQVHSGELIHLVAADNVTEGSDNDDKTSIGSFNNFNPVGVLFGENPDFSDNAIVVDQGIDNREFVTPIGDLKETVFIIQIDGKFGEIVDFDGAAISTVQTDDDGMKFYTVNQDTTENNIFKSNITSNKVHAGTVGNRITFKIRSSTILRNNDSYFERYGFSKPIIGGDTVTPNDTKCIDTIVRVTGVTYGGQLDIPVRFVKHG